MQMNLYTFSTAMKKSLDSIILDDSLTYNQKLEKVKQSVSEFKDVLDDYTLNVPVICQRCNSLDWDIDKRFYCKRKTKCKKGDNLLWKPQI